ncbi:tetratricopeptide repeat-containing protein (plasmid) [Rhizobium phaseoli]|uniref:tyrosine-protein kinase family protein n=1 Tax=Rhizobium phaseoli TaxID=396 RepID=UPI0007EAD3DC|nr:ParA family protein [Rhizobium phaseoli]ANL68581.1 tetratricopeptide repeat-containing protein [Rhizobium phaseoli]ANL81390.1 tetratricopeptide repeat-containing protein [Rhizobium phaseoli]
MFTITFYSYKGGVGRTMALVNVAAELARRGRKVLIIDFDLEAPGIPSFEPFALSDRRVGIVDYVNQYIETAVAPDVSDFVVEARIDVSPDKTSPIWIMPAGKRDETYSRKLSSIDWQDLYENRQGYVLFQDMKQQLALDSREFDYVLIDSRTGHTDVGGICTRQLADAISFMFFPNDQNISGLKTIVDEIRNDPQVQSKQTKLLFCPSNVPDLDDEDDILKSMLDRASRYLGYDKPSATIRHYNSLSLVDQKIFVVDRPRTKLASQYRTLTEALMQTNLLDREGALLFLAQLRKEQRRNSREKRSPSFSPELSADALSDLEKIAEHHRADGEICWRVAAIYHDLGNFAYELEALNGAIDANYNLQKAHFSRAFTLLSVSRAEEAIPDLIAVIASSETTAMELRSAMEALRRRYPSWVEAVKLSPLLDKARPEDVETVSKSLVSDVASLDLAVEVLGRSFGDPTADIDTKDDLKSDLILALISSRQYARAMHLIVPGGDGLSEEASIRDVFNYAVASWGDTGVPPRELFQRVLELDDGDTSDANYSQCIALAHAVVGNRVEAFDVLARARSGVMRSSIFSCWRYLYGDRNELIADLDAMEKAISIDELTPPFFKGDEQRQQRLPV